MIDLNLIQQQELWLLFFFFTLFVGLSVGSFLNVVIYRLPIMLERQWVQEAKGILELEPDTEQKVFNLALPHSSCPGCGTVIRAWQNIPVLSYLFLRGKCASCRVAISPRYPFVELVTGVASIFLYLQIGPSLLLLAFLLMTYISIALIGIDFDHQILPDVLTLPLLWLGLLINTQSFFVPLEDAVWGAIFGYGSLWSVYWMFKWVTGKEGMGFGDFKLLAAYGAWFGWQVLPNIILLSSLVGAVLGVILIVVKGRDSQQPMPFGPFIAIAAWLTSVYPEIFIVTQYI